MFDEQKSNENELTPDLAAFERQLRGLAHGLAAPRIDRDQLMLAAGRAAAEGPVPATPRAARSRAWLWPAATFTMTAATLFLATMLVWQNHEHAIALQQAMAPGNHDLASNPQPAVAAVASGGANNGREADALTYRNAWKTIP